MSDQIPCEIISSNENWGIVEKAAGFSVHNEPGRDVLSFLQKKFPRAAPSLPHRLDQETSGLLLFALNPESHRLLQESLSQETTVKKYVALLRGQMKVDEAIWTWALSDKAEGRKNPQGISQDRKPCETRIQIQNKNSYFSLAKCQIKTGRQHQIRKHAAMAGHPLIGDSRYNDKKFNEKISQIYSVNRLFLHAESLAFQFSGRDYFYSSPVPAEFARLCST